MCHLRPAKGGPQHALTCASKQAAGDASHDSEFRRIQGCQVMAEETKKIRVSKRPEGGYTLVEFAVTIGLIAIITGIAILQLMPTLQQNRSLAALDQVKTTLRQARELAISERRIIVVTFTGNNTINLFQVTEPANTVATTAFLSIPIENNVQFMTFTGEADTPDAFGMPTVPAGTQFTGAVGNMQFNTDGSFGDSTGAPVSGTIFLGVPNMPISASAVTIMGTTGRVRSYRSSGSGWWR
jgi:Tfp pilus assembly protein FimT